MLNLILQGDEDLNTSHVNVNHSSKYGIKCPYSNLNTSHVNVNLGINITLSLKLSYLNTSHVNVNLKRRVWNLGGLII